MAQPFAPEPWLSVSRSAWTTLQPAKATSPKPTIKRSAAPTGWARMEASAPSLPWVSDRPKAENTAKPPMIR
jgi:hypothetical protein